MPLIDAKFAEAAKILVDADDEVLQTAGMLALMRLETLERRIKGISTGKGPLTPLPTPQDCAPKEEKKTELDPKIKIIATPLSDSPFAFNLTPRVQNTSNVSSANKEPLSENFSKSLTPIRINATPTKQTVDTFAKENLISLAQSKSSTNEKPLVLGSTNVSQFGLGLKKESTVDTKKNVSLQESSDNKKTFSFTNTNDSLLLPVAGDNSFTLSLKEKSLQNAHDKPLILFEDTKKSTVVSENSLVPVKPSRESLETQTDTNISRKLLSAVRRNDSRVSLSSAIFRENRTLERDIAQMDYGGTMNFIQQRNVQTSHTNSWTFNAPRYSEMPPLTLNNYILNIQQGGGGRWGGGGGGCGCRQIQCADRRCGCKKQGIGCGSSCACSSRGGWCLNR